MIFRLALPLFAIVTGCTSPLAQEREAITTDLLELQDGSGLLLFAITAGVNEAARPLRTELEMNVGGFVPEGILLEAAFTDTSLQTVPSERPSSHPGETAAAFELEFAACEEGPRYTLLDDGGCESSLIGSVTASSPFEGARVGFVLRTFADDAEVSEEEVELLLDVVEVEGT